MTAVVKADQLQKTFALGFFRKKVRAVDGVSFEVQENEIFGFLGPNGAGKTTTLKMLMGLIFPTAGAGYLFGKKVPDLDARRRLGFLPENPYFYDYLSGEELLDFMGRLFGLHDRKRRAHAAQSRRRPSRPHRALRRSAARTGADQPARQCARRDGRR